MIFRIEPLQNGRFRVAGELTFDTVSKAHRESLALFDRAGRALCIDLSDVSHTDSAGVALLIGWMRYASGTRKALRFLNMPDQMRAIVQASGLDRILPLSESPPRSSFTSPRSPPG